MLGLMIFLGFLAFVVPFKLAFMDLNVTLAWFQVYIYPW